MSKRNERKGAAPPAIYLLAASLAAIAGFGTVYVSFAPSDNGRSDETGPASAASGPAAGAANAPSPLAGLNKGAMAPLIVRAKPLDLPDFTVTFGEGGTKSLKDFTGKVVLLNIWATWCVPCRKEMTALDRLQARLGGPDFEVVALSIDKKGLLAVEAFYAELGLNALAIYVDESGRAASQVGALGLPTTLLVDAQGIEIGRVVGPREWDSPASVAEIERRIGRASGAPKAPQDPGFTFQWRRDMNPAAQGKFA